MTAFSINILKTIAIPLLAMLLLIAPCSVRNHIESSLGIETTKTLNPSKTINNQVTCSVFDNTVEKQNFQVFKKQIQNKLTLTLTSKFLFSLEKKTTISVVNFEGYNWTPPYYILYKRLKIFDLDKNFFV